MKAALRRSARAVAAGQMRDHDAASSAAIIFARRWSPAGDGSTRNGRPVTAITRVRRSALMRSSPRIASASSALREKSPSRWSLSARRVCGIVHVSAVRSVGAREPMTRGRRGMSRVSVVIVAFVSS